MKTIFKTFCIIALAAMVCSCGNSVESKARNYVKSMLEATSEGKLLEVSKISQKASEYRESLSDEDKVLFDKAGEEAMEELSKEYEEKMEEGVKKAADNAGKLLEGAGSLMDAVNEATNDSDE